MKAQDEDTLYADIRHRLIASLQERLAAHDILKSPSNWLELEDYHRDNSRVILQALLYLIERSP
jgi:hypothetical protein